MNRIPLLILIYDVIRLTEIYSPFELEFYLGRCDNPFYIGPESLEETARFVVSSSGPSGTNREYLYRLAEAVRHLLSQQCEDEEPYLMSLERVVRALEQ